MLCRLNRAGGCAVGLSGKDADLIERTIDRDTWMSSDEAKDFGLLDGIVGSFQELGFE